MAPSTKTSSRRERATVQELAGLHCLAAGALQSEDANRAMPASDREIIVDHRARDAPTFALGRAQHPDAPGRLSVLLLPLHLEPGTGIWRQAADVVVHLSPRPR